MKKYLALTMLAIACSAGELPETSDYQTDDAGVCARCDADQGAPGDDYDPVVDNPTLEENFAWDGTVDKIYIEGNYGFEVDATKCSPPWSGGVCGVPDLRTFSIGVHQYTCSAQLFKDQILDAANWARDTANANGWNISVHVYITGPAPGQTFDLSDPFDIRCTTSNGEVPEGRVGRTDCSENIDHLLDCHDTQFGRVCQYRNCNIAIHEPRIKASSGYQNSATTNTQRGFFVENTCRHEFGHALGFGHCDNCPGILMQPAVSVGLPLQSVWTELKTLTQTEKHQMDCYKETSGTTSNCQ